MTHSKQLAGFIGPVALAIGVAVLLNRAMVAQMASQIAGNYPLIFVTGILSLLAGITVLRLHNDWSGGWPVIITALGWLLVAGGLARMWFPQAAQPIATSFAGSEATMLVAGAVFATLGAFLTYKAYGRDA